MEFVIDYVMVLTVNGYNIILHLNLVQFVEYVE